MKVLVLGGNGFIGTNLVDQLVATGHKVRVYDRSPSKLREQLTNVEYQYGILHDITAISQALHEIDVVIHLISSSVPSTSNFSPADDIRDNLVDTIGLLECMREANIRRIIYMSSGGTIYGDSDEDLINEDHALNPNCSYGIVKLAVEKYLMMYARLYNFESVVFRVSNPYGPWQGKVGLQGFVGTVLTKAINKEPIEVWGDGEVIRDYLYISDLICACMYVLNTNITGIFNIGSGVGYSINQIIKLVEEMTSNKLEVSYVQPREVDVKKVVLDIAKVKNELVWAPKINITEGLNKHYKWLQSL